MAPYHRTFRLPSSRAFRQTTIELESLKSAAAIKRKRHGVTARQLRRKSSRFARKNNMVLRLGFAQRQEQRHCRELEWLLQRFREVIYLFNFILIFLSTQILIQKNSHLHWLILPEIIFTHRRLRIYLDRFRRLLLLVRLRSLLPVMLHRHHCVWNYVYLFYNSTDIKESIFASARKAESHFRELAENYRRSPQKEPKFADVLHERAFYQAVVDMESEEDSTEEEGVVDVLNVLGSGRVINWIKPGDKSIFLDVCAPSRSLGSPPPESVSKKFSPDAPSPPSAQLTLLPSGDAALPASGDALSPPSPLPPLLLCLIGIIEFNAVFSWSLPLLLPLMFFASILRVMMLNIENFDVDLIGDTTVYNMLHNTSRVELELQYNIYTPQNRIPFYPKKIFYMGHEKRVGQRSRTGNHRVLAGSFF